MKDVNYYKDRARELFKEGYNCSQAVFGAFAEELGISFETAVLISSSFGGGMGRLREVCGAVSGMFMAAGIAFGTTDITNHNAKSDHYALIQSLASDFREQNGSIICRELLGLSDKKPDVPIPEKRTEEYYKKRPCAELCADAAEIFAKRFIESKKKND